LIRRIKENIERASEGSAEDYLGMCLHLDLASTVTGKFNKILLELCLFGHVTDEDAGRSFTWSPLSTTISVEIASGTLWGKLLLCWTLSSRVARACPETFVSSEGLLQAGMGADFESARYDGTVDQTQDLAVERRSAHARLRYVCNALWLLNKYEGNFPYLYPERDGDNVEQPLQELSGDVCFNLLAEASNLASKPSLWCLWNFINVMYWQISDLHHSESPLNTACMPDKESHVGDDGN
jgi:hypothetical protein